MTEFSRFESRKALCPVSHVKMIFNRIDADFHFGGNLVPRLSSSWLSSKTFRCWEAEGL